jgi:hypothetical protein
MCRPPAANRPPKPSPNPGAFDYSLDSQAIDFRRQPELDRVGKGEQGVLLVEPYKGEFLPHWRLKTVAEAKRSSATIYKLVLAYLKAEGFPGADMTRLGQPYSPSPRGRRCPDRYETHADGVNLAGVRVKLC